jgi:hypothetical protein
MNTSTMSRRRTTILGGFLVLALVASAIGSSGIVVAQQEPPDKDTDGTITKSEFRSWVHRIDQATEKKAKQLVKKNPKMAKILSRVALRTGQYQTDPMPLIRRNPKGVVTKLLTYVENRDGAIRVPNLPVEDSKNDGNGQESNKDKTGKNPKKNTSGKNSSINIYGDGSDKTQSKHPVKATLLEFKNRKLGWDELTAGRKQKIKTILTQLNQKDLTGPERNTLLKKFRETWPGTKSTNGVTASERLKVIYDHFGIDLSAHVKAPDVPGMIGWLLGGYAKAFVDGAAQILTDIYNLAFSTPVPENSGWHGIFGTPTNEPFQTLHQQLLVEKLYPVTNALLGIGILLLGASLAVNPFMSRHQIWNFLIKFVTFLTLYAFSWTVISLMHGIVNDITVWIRPSASAVGGLSTEIAAIAVASVGAYFALGAGILSTMFSLGVELGMRQVLLTNVFPYVFPALVMILYISPWQRLRKYASMALWQYVNVLTIIIPMAILLKAATIVGYSSGNSIAAILVLIALFLFAAAYPLLSTYFFLKMGGKITGGMKAAASDAASKVGTAKERLDWRGDTASDTSATGGASTGSQARASVTAGQQSESSATSSSASSQSSHTTTAQTIRDLYDGGDDDPMSPADMKEYVNNHPKTATLKEKFNS